MLSFAIGANVNAKIIYDIYRPSFRSTHIYSLYIALSHLLYTVKKNML